MKHKVSELEGALLDAAVAKAEGDAPRAYSGGRWADEDGTPMYSECWGHGGEIIERERIGVAWFDATGILDGDPKEWRAGYVDGGGYFSSLDFEHKGPTPLIAAMRAYVARKFISADWRDAVEVDLG